MTTNVKRDRWVCRDDAGLLHNTMVARYFNSDDKLVTLQVSTACRPKVVQVEGLEGRWPEDKLPSVMMDNIMILEYRVRDYVTCLQCLAVPEI